MVLCHGLIEAFKKYPDVERVWARDPWFCATASLKLQEVDGVLGLVGRDPWFCATASLKQVPDRDTLALLVG